MSDKYFITYKPETESEPYKLPDTVRNSLNSIEGVVIEFEGSTKPVVIAAVPKDKLDMIKSLDLVISVHEDVQFHPFKE